MYTANNGIAWIWRYPRLWKARFTCTYRFREDC